MGKYQRTKGHSYERRVARLLRRVTLLPFFRVDENRKGKGVDVAVDPDEESGESLVTGGLLVQCKNVEKLTVPKAYEEVAGSPLAGPSNLCVLWHHRSHGRHLVTLDERDFLALLCLAEWWNAAGSFEDIRGTVTAHIKEV